jgi:hypothetical protein
MEAAIGRHPVGARLDRLDPPSVAAAILRCAEDAAGLRSAVAALARQLRWETESLRLSRLVDEVTHRPVRIPRQAEAVA